MRIGELAGELGLNPKTIRYYESIGLLPEPARTSSGYRDYDDRATDLMRFIRSAQRLGITLDEIREILAFRERGEQPCDYVRQVLSRQVDEIDERIADLRQLRKELVMLDAIADSLPSPRGGQCRLIDHARQQADPAEVRPSRAGPGRQGRGVQPGIR